VNKEPVYIMVPRKLLVTWVITTLVLFIAVVASFQYTNYVDRRSNRAWCGTVELFTNTYKRTPPTTASGQILANEFVKLSQRFECK
jgi:hypothetical protein